VLKKIGAFVLLYMVCFSLIGNDFLETSKEACKVSSSRVAQFSYLKSNNIGDYLPTLAFWQELGYKTDLYCIKNRKIDFNFINKNYDYIVIGGGGILSKRSHHFYQDIVKKCNLPIVIWGCGMCLPYGKTHIQKGFDKNTAKKLASQSLFISLRDQLTKKYYNFKDAIVSCCPCILYLQQFKNMTSSNNNKILYSCHPHLVKDIDNKKIIDSIREAVGKDYFTYTDHSFKKEKTVQEIDNVISNRYCKSKLVVTTRLHGAIIAYALGIPYIAIPYDKKIKAFHQDYGNGWIVENLDDLSQAIKNYKNIELKPIKIEEVKNVASYIKNIINS
jgi:polysaccharide pyruvyl transferase WcaK-like protein